MEVSTIFSHTTRVGHRCQKKGCGMALVLDGNQKNNRPVCAAEDAGFVEYAGLSGKVKTGCMDTPEQRRCFCTLHKPRQMNIASIDTKGQQETWRGVIEMILSKKALRDKTLYEVSMVR